MLRTRLPQSELNPCHGFNAPNIHQPVVPLYRRRTAHPTFIPPPSCGHRLHVGLEEALLVRSTSLTRKGDEKTLSRIAPALSWALVRVTKRENGVTVTSQASSLTKQSWNRAPRWNCGLAKSICQSRLALALGTLKRRCYSVTCPSYQLRQ